jgi:hypothetical protein
MARYLLIIISGLFLLSFITIAILWARSHYDADFVTIGVPQTSSTNCVTCGFVSNEGLCRVGWQNGNLVMSNGFQYRHIQPFTWRDRTTFWRRLGFSYDSAKNYQLMGRHCDYVSLTFPYCAVLTVIVGMPIIYVLLSFRRYKLVAPIPMHRVKKSAEGKQGRTKPKLC